MRDRKSPQSKEKHYLFRLRKLIMRGPIVQRIPQRGRTTLLPAKIDYALFNSIGQNRSFLAGRSAPPRIKRLARTKTPGKTFVVLAGFCHSEA